jgi:hypothetical protein
LWNKFLKLLDPLLFLLQLVVINKRWKMPQINKRPIVLLILPMGKRASTKEGSLSGSLHKPKLATLNSSIVAPDRSVRSAPALWSRHQLQNRSTSSLLLSNWCAPLILIVSNHLMKARSWIRVYSHSMVRDIQPSQISPPPSSSIIYTSKAAAWTHSSRQHQWTQPNQRAEAPLVKTFTVSMPTTLIPTTVSGALSICSNWTRWQWKGLILLRKSST